MDYGKEHGQLQDLSSPILSKVQEAFTYMNRCLADEANAEFSGFGSLQGPKQSTMFVAWDKPNSRLVLSCRIMDYNFLTGMREGKFVPPPWLAHLAGDAQVELNCLRVLQAFVAPDDGGTDLKSLIKSTTGGEHPRRIVCVGFCAAGSVATLAAAWAAVQWPTADVRCISFGAPAVGNTPFTAAFKWLVGISYRVMFRRDPVPEALGSAGLKHVHGAVYVCGDAMRPGCQPKGQIAPLADMGDHALPSYSGALFATCKAQCNREKATGGACKARFDTHGSSRPSAIQRRSTSLRSEGSLSLGSAASTTETIDSIEDDDDEPVVSSKQPTGLMAYMTLGASNLFLDTLSVSKLAVLSAAARVGRLLPGSKRKPPSGEDAAACGHGGLDNDESARLSCGDGFVAQDDAYLIFGGSPPTGVITPGDNTIRVDREGLGNASDVLMHIEMESEPQQELTQSSGSPSAAALAAAHSTSTDVLTGPDRQTMSDASQHLTNLGMAAVAVNEAEVSLGEEKLNAKSEQGPGPLAPGVSLPADVIDDFIAEETGHPRKGAASLGPDDIAAAEEQMGVRSGVKAAHPRLARTFSLLERDSWQVDQNDLSDLQKVLVMGKISQAAIVAGAAYRNEETFKQQTGIANARLIKDKLHHDTKVHVGWLEGGTAVFAFRGTASKQDGLQDVKIFSRNIDYLQELYPGVKAHMGFMQQFAAVCNPDKPDTNIAAVLKELSGGQTPNRVICCGHSLGGALATLGAAWAALEYPDADIRCITFGSPRVANKVFGRAFSALVGTSLRLVHGFDPVPSLPPSLMYKHVPGVVHIKQDRLLLKHRPWHTMLRSSVTDHGMRKYSMGVYKHMPGGLEAHVAFFAVRPAARLCDKVAQAAQRAVGVVGTGQEQNMPDDSKQHQVEDVSSPTKPVNSTSSRKGRHTRSKSSSFDWLCDETQPEASLSDGMESDKSEAVAMADPNFSAAATERLHNITPMAAEAF